MRPSPWGLLPTLLQPLESKPKPIPARLLLALVPPVIVRLRLGRSSAPPNMHMRSPGRPDRTLVPWPEDSKVLSTACWARGDCAPRAPSPGCGGHTVLWLHPGHGVPEPRARAPSP